VFEGITEFAAELLASRSEDRNVLFFPEESPLRC